MPHCIHAWLKQLFSLCVLAVLVTGNGTPDTSDGESDAATDPSLFCTCRCNGCMWRMRCYDKNSSRLVLSEDACSAKGGTWCSCSQQAAAFSLAEKTGFAPFLASVGASVKDSCDERVPHDHKSEKRRPPHIVFALADDIGFHDVSWRNPIAVTPTLHALREAGVELTNFYTQSMCSPSRAALATGRYPMRYGMQSYVLIDHQPWGLPLSEVTLAQELKSVFGYETQYIGQSCCHQLYMCVVCYFPFCTRFDGDDDVSLLWVGGGMYHLPQESGTLGHTRGSTHRWNGASMVFSVPTGGCRRTVRT